MKHLNQFQAAFITTLWPVWAIGIAKMLSNVCAALSFQFSGRLIDHFTAIKILLFSTIYRRAIGLLALAWTSLISPILPASTSLLFGVTMVARSALDQREFTDEQRATMGSLSSLIGSLFFGCCAILVGLVADRIGATYTLLLAELCRLPVIWLYWRVFSGRNKR